MIITSRRGFMAGLLATPFMLRLASLYPKRHIFTSAASISMDMEKIRQYLPHGVDFYDNNGQTVFHMYGSSGGLLTKNAMFLVDYDNHLASCVEINIGDSTEHIHAKLKHALTHFHSVNFDGGELPRSDYVHQAQS